MEVELTRDSDIEALTPEQVAKYLNVPVASVWRQVRQGLIPHFRLGERLIRFNRQALAEWQRAQMSAK